MREIKMLLTQLLSGDDEHSIELFRVLAVMSVPGYLLLATIDLLFISRHWEPISFGAGLSAALLAVAAQSASRKVRSQSRRLPRRQSSRTPRTSAWARRTTPPR